MGGDAVKIEGPTIGYNEGMEQIGIGCKNWQAGSSSATSLHSLHLSSSIRIY